MNAATLKDHQRKGYVTAVIHVAVREAVKETGIRRLMLISSPSGRPIYEKRSDATDRTGNFT
jgi:hypothetical protein